MMNETWIQYIGDIEEGRKNLGPDMPVSIYRLFEFTMKEALVERYGIEEAIETFRFAGKLAGLRFAHEMLNLSVDFPSFISEIQQAMKQSKMGLFRVEAMDEEAKELTLAIKEDLDCSGLPISGDTVCNYDEGFLQGVLKAYTNEEYEVKEIDCWANGGRVCRFQATR